MAFRFIHMADVHLDTPFKNKNSGTREKLRDGVRQAFRAAVDLALQKQADAVLAAGDLFDNSTLSFATEKFLLEQVSRLEDKKIPFIYAPGNHDPWGSSYRLSSIPWPPGVKIFSSRRPQVIEIKDESGRLKALVCGAGHESLQEGENLAESFPRLDAKVPKVGLLHALVTGVRGASEHERYAPCSLDDLQGKEYHYWALGHIHNRSVLMKNPWVVYPGNIMGRHHRENGSKGVYLVDIDEKGEVTADFFALAPYYWLDLDVAGLEGIGSLVGLQDAVSKQLQTALQGEDISGEIMLRANLIGQCPLYRELADEVNIEQLREDLELALRIEALELNVEDVIRPVNPEDYRQGPHVLSTVLEICRQLLDDDDYLLQLAPKDLAGVPKSALREEKLVYLRGLLQGLDIDAAARLVEEDKK